MISFYTRALLFLRRPPCWNKHGAARTTQHVTSRQESAVPISVLSLLSNFSQISFCSTQ